MENVKIRKRIWLGALLVSFLMILIFNGLTPYLTDDFSYAAVVRQANGFWDYFVQEYEQYNSWTGRSVVHLLLRFMLAGPKWVFNILNSIVFVGMTVLMYFLVGHKKKWDVRLFAGITVLVWLGVISPAETLFWETGAVNYLWGTTIILGFLVTFRHLMKSDSLASGKGVLIAILMFFFGVIAGWCNENTSGGGLLLSLGSIAEDRFVSGKKKPALWMITAALGQFVGLLLMVVAPGNSVRSQYQEENHSGLFGLVARFQKITLVVQKEYFILIAIFVFLLVLALCQKKKCAELRRGLYFGFVFVATSYALILTATPQDRAYFGAGIFLMIGIWNLYEQVTEEEVLVRALKISAVILALVWFAFFYLDNGTNLIRIYRESSERIEYIMEQKAAGNNEEIYVPMLRPEFETELSDAYESDLTEDPKYWINNSWEMYFEVGSIIGVPREEWEKMTGR